MRFELWWFGCTGAAIVSFGDDWRLGSQQVLSPTPPSEDACSWSTAWWLLSFFFWVIHHQQVLVDLQSLPRVRCILHLMCSGSGSAEQERTQTDKGPDLVCSTYRRPDGQSMTAISHGVGRRQSMLAAPETQSLHEFFDGHFHFRSKANFAIRRFNNPPDNIFSPCLPLFFQPSSLLAKQI